MRRLALTALLFAPTAIGACSLINAPSDVIPGGGGAGGMPSTVSVTSTASSSASSTTSASSSSASSSASGTGGGSPCTGAADCAALTDQCNDGVCNAGACEKMPHADATPCDDGAFCTVSDVCTAGVCAGSTKVCPDMVGTSSAGTGGSGGATSIGTGGAGGGPTVPPLDACHVWSCNEAQKVCEVIPGTSGVACDDSEPCTSGEICAPDGSCGNGLPTDCSGLNSECGAGTCTPGVGCELLPQAEGILCNTANTCATSKCAAGKCNILTPINTGGTCDDGLYCTANDKCLPSGFCGGGPKCVDPTACITSSCDEAAKKCVLDPKVDGEVCATSACVAGQTCNGGICGGGVMAQTYFYENFANNSKGWLLGPEWQIGSAKVSTGGTFGADPAQDNSPTPDNGVAGVVIGGNENPVIHPQYYIESPIIDATVAQGQLFLTFYRWLNSDYLNFMKNVIEVYDGTKWVEIWASGFSPGIQDSPPAGQGWTFISHDITQYKNAGLRVRFGYDIESSGVYTIGSWNLDDVKLQNTVCPTVP